MNTVEVANLFRKYTDESDTSFLTDDDVALYLRLGYGDFRQVIENIDTFQYVNSETYTTGFGQELNLANAAPYGADIMGNLATRPLKTILRIYAPNGTGGIEFFYTPVQNKEALYSVPNDYLTKYCLEGTKLTFSATLSSNITIEYQAMVPSSLFTAVTVTIAPSFIDQFQDFHDLIALFAYSQYAIRDVADNAPLNARMAMRKQMLQDYISRGLNQRANRFVISDDAYFVT